MSYMIEGKGSKTLSKAKKWLYTHPEASMKLLQKMASQNRLSDCYLITRNFTPV